MVHIAFTETVAIHRMARTLAAEAGDTQQEAAFTRCVGARCSVLPACLRASFSLSLLPPCVCLLGSNGGYQCVPYTPTCTQPYKPAEHANAARMAAVDRSLRAHPPPLVCRRLHSLSLAHATLVPLLSDKAGWGLGATGSWAALARLQTCCGGLQHKPAVCRPPPADAPVLSQALPGHPHSPARLFTWPPLPTCRLGGPLTTRRWGSLLSCCTWCLTPRWRRRTRSLWPALSAACTAACR